MVLLRFQDRFRYDIGQSFSNKTTPIHNVNPNLSALPDLIVFTYVLGRPAIFCTKLIETMFIAQTLKKLGGTFLDMREHRYLWAAFLMLL